MLGKNVPSIVFIQNKRLLKDAVIEELQNNQDKSAQIRLKAQINEHVYSLLKDYGVLVKIDENIGTEFFDFDKLTPDMLRINSHVSMSSQFTSGGVESEYSSSHTFPLIDIN